MCPNTTVIFDCNNGTLFDNKTSPITNATKQNHNFLFIKNGTIPYRTDLTESIDVKCFQNGGTDYVWMNITVTGKSVAPIPMHTTHM